MGDFIVIPFEVITFDVLILDLGLKSEKISVLIFENLILHALNKRSLNVGIFNLLPDYDLTIGNYLTTVPLGF